MVKMGVFIPIGSRGWLISTTSPKTKPSFDLNRTVVQQAEHYGLDFALSMIKMRGFGGPSGYWDENLESFTLMAGIAAVTRRIQLFASVAVLTVPPGLRRPHGRHHRQHRARPLRHEHRVRLAADGVPADGPVARRGAFRQALRILFRIRNCHEAALGGQAAPTFKGEFFTMEDCQLEPRPSRRVEIVGAAQSDRGMRFVADHGDYCFCGSGGLNRTGERGARRRTVCSAAAVATGRDVGALVLLMVIADATDELAMAKWQHYKDGVDHEALAWQRTQATADTKASTNSTVGQMVERQKADPIPTGQLKLIGSYAAVARMLDQVAATPGVKGILMTFDDFVIGMEQFGQYIQPLMESRKTVQLAA